MRSRLPIMVHPQDAWCESLDDILAVMRGGDILTHCFHGLSHGILDADGRVRRSVHEAMERGVIFDVGHGAGSFSWQVAERTLKQGVEPQTISSDLHAQNVNGPVYDLATTVTKFLHLGFPLETALHKVTATPAQVIRMADEIGTLRVGAWGDAVVFELEEGRFDSHGLARRDTGGAAAARAAHGRARGPCVPGGRAGESVPHVHHHGHPIITTDEGRRPRVADATATRPDRDG